jgi:hypothetical protein
MSKEPCIVVSTKIPWVAHHDRTVILSNPFNGHVYIETGNRVKERHYVGDAKGLRAPIMMGDFRTVVEKTQPPVLFHKIMSIVLSRFQNRVQTLQCEKIARSVILTVAVEGGVVDTWVDLEKIRLRQLVEDYTLPNIRLIYPMVRSLDTACDDVEKSYIDGRVMPMTLQPELTNALAWAIDFINKSTS